MTQEEFETAIRQVFELGQLWNQQTSAESYREGLNSGDTYRKYLGLLEKLSTNFATQISEAESIRYFDDEQVSALFLKATGEDWVSERDIRGLRLFVDYMYQPDVADSQDEDDDHCITCNDTCEGQAPDSACPICSHPGTRKYRGEP